MSNERNAEMKTVTFVANKKDWNEFGKILAREGDGSTRGRNSLRSKKLREWIREYNNRHRKGNPQLFMDPFLPGFSGTVHQCYRCGGSGIPLWKVLYISGEKLPTCKTCIQWNREHRLVKKVLTLI